jgi:predicted AlkP superfamily pyrophosphatase or phosphodiesterase
MNTEVFRKHIQELINRHTFSEDFIFPDYPRLSLKNLLPQIAAIFGVGSLNCSTLPNDCLAEIQGIKRVILVVLDGLGYNRLLFHLDNHNSTFAELAEKGVLKPITTVFPSTTSTALTSLFSGLSPAQHQIIGYLMFSKKYALVHNTLDMKPVYGYSGKVELAQDYAKNIKPLIPTLEQNGIKTTLITKAQIIRSGLSHVTHKDIAPIPYLLSSDMWTHTIETMNNQSPCLSIVYYSGVDNLGHKYGAYSKEITFELTSIEHSLYDFIKSLSREVKDETLLIVTGDHGIAEIKQSYYLKDTPELMQHLFLPPVGDGRATYLFCKNGQREAFARSFEKQIEGFKLYSTDELIQRGLFGEPIDKDGLKERLGDFTALSNSDMLLEYPYFEEDREHPQLGAHGGMTAEEIVVPLLSTKLSNL